MKKFGNVQSRVNEPQNAPEKKHTFLKATMPMGPPSTQPKAPTTSRVTTKPSVPTVKEMVQMPEREERNFIQSNARDAIVSKSKRESNKDESFVQKGDFGKVPLYLRERQMEWADQERRRIESLPDPDVPEGMMKLPESERVNTLGVLRKNHEEVTQSLNTMPMIVDTPSLRKKKESLEEQLLEIEEGIKIFERKVVYVYED
eukprot:TRINITY_DN9818_c0_g1_i1.p1 TRINITY_DN9818_c0_g1~~TRINITY_DN9818_c0_g1_i1.p1  ORF type:complete len:229 (+),score=60.43 TRINITY_DN9818_c0_g1_i1:84-689(+)